MPNLARMAKLQAGGVQRNSEYLPEQLDSGVEIAYDVACIWVPSLVAEADLP